MTHTKDEALKLALVALEDVDGANQLGWWTRSKAITAIKQALAAQPASKESSETQTASAYVKTYHGGKPWPLQPAPGRNHWEDGDVFERIATKAKGQP